MSLQIPLTITTITILITLTLTSTSSSSTTTSSFYSLLTSNALPIGLFPKNISSVNLDPTSNCFRLRLLSPSPCDTKFETRVRYDRNITGCVNYGRIGNLSGVAAQELFLWLPVKGVQVDVPSSGLIYFDVGVVEKQFSLSFFEVPLDCDVEGEKEGEGILTFDHLNKPADFTRKRIVDQEGKAVS